MRQDPYGELWGLMQSAGQASGPVGPAHLRLGTVLSAAPLKVDVAGTTQEADRFYIAHRLLKQHTELLDLDGDGVSARLSISASCGNGSHSHMEVHSGTLKLRCTAAQAEPVLKQGDLVLLLTEDDQKFFLLDKVVSVT